MPDFQDKVSSTVMAALTESGLQFECNDDDSITVIGSNNETLTIKFTNE